VAVTLLAAQNQPTLGRLDRERMLYMLETVAKAVREKYYDPSFHGVDIEARFREAENKIKVASSVSQAITAIAASLDYLEDSHTYFLPPPRNTRYAYGWRMQMVGDRCLITEVKPGSDAEAKGLTPGDEVLSIRNYPPTRQSLPKLGYYFEFLRPQPTLALRVRGPSGEEQDREIGARITTLQQIMGVTLSDFLEPEREAEHVNKLRRPKYVELAEGVIAVKMPRFNLDAEGTDNLLRRLRKAKKVILDLRGNPGGAEESLVQFIEGMFEGEVMIGTLISRKERKPFTARGLGKRSYSGEMIVLVDSQTSSAAEVFARVVQIEKRGRVIGDISSGRVMRARVFQAHVGVDIVTFFGAAITDSDLIMKDGQSLEGRGVTPDEVLLPTPQELRAHVDPVLARACALFGISVKPEVAGRWFPYEWLPD
jgi:C-terminal processing protease CtpA/Prc